MLEMAPTVNLISLLISFSGNYSTKMKKNFELSQFAARRLEILQREKEKSILLLLDAVISEAHGNP